MVDKYVITARPLSRDELVEKCESLKITHRMQAGSVRRREREIAHLHATHSILHARRKEQCLENVKARMNAMSHQIGEIESALVQLDAGDTQPARRILSQSQSMFMAN